MSLLKDPQLDLTKETILLSSGIELIPFPNIPISYDQVLKSWDDPDGDTDNKFDESNRCHAFIRNSVLRTRTGLAYYVYCILGGTYIGNAGIELISSPANISIELLPEYQRKGYATEIYRTLIEWVKIRTRIAVLSHITRETNNSSIRLAERVGGILQDTPGDLYTCTYWIPVR